MKKNFFGRNNKSKSSAFGKFLFYHNVICFDRVMNFFLSSMMFSVKKVSFPAKTAVATYHPLLQNIGKIFHRHLDLLYTDQEVERVFTPGPMASFRSAPKISSYLVQAKLYPLERHVGSFKCGGRHCQVCLNVTQTETFTSTSTNQTYKINHEFNCNGSSLIYLLMCKIYRRQHVHVAQRVDIFRSRWNNYKSNDRKYLIGHPCMQEHIFEHFNSEGHTGFLQNVSYIY